MSPRSKSEFRQRRSCRRSKRARTTAVSAELNIKYTVLYRRSAKYGRTEDRSKREFQVSARLEESS
jgi:hypothetical protein